MFFLLEILIVLIIIIIIVVLIKNENARNILRTFSLTKPVEEQSLKQKFIPSFNSFESFGEKKCTDILETIFNNRKFSRFTENGINLRCFNRELMLNIEYENFEKYCYPNHVDKTETEFLERQKIKDSLHKYCIDKNIYVIYIPYDTQFSEIEKILMEKIPKCILNLR